MGNNGPPGRVKEAAATLQWWLNALYLSSNQSVSPFQIVRLPIAYQKDFSSCSIFALNALMHHFIPSQYSLGTSNDMVMIRIKLLVSILDHHAAHGTPGPEAITPITTAAPVVATPVAAIGATTMPVRVTVPPVATIPVAKASHQQCLPK
ncbi:uncharacterized protein EI90DRAFT_3124555 [Cantharellus anzutake]|uniref:uncharacterized protein n=1 Tax=Cantharellus anzutake TaxID=1750568 RepID=UPI0019081A97|nr:uncharacterized protein EI90DRAFT_3124555 [Cantharellus anzutake]KAF8330140.1 hypothetical protein EI90DRAFT_3124555 [Cantharellus anzutake]